MTDHISGIRVTGRLKPIVYVEALSGAKEVTIRIDDERDLAFWLQIDLTEEALRGLLERLEEARADALDEV